MKTTVRAPETTIKGVWTQRCTADRITAAHLPVGVGEAIVSSSPSLDYHDTLEQTKREVIVRAFEQAGHSHAGAARLLGVHPNYLHRLLAASHSLLYRWGSLRLRLVIAAAVHIAHDLSQTYHRAGSIMECY